MEPVVTPAQMRAADERTIADDVPGAVLMDSAAHACAITALRMMGGSYGKRVAIVCGKGNNGGDGIACARHLACFGVPVALFLLADPVGDGAEHMRRIRSARVRAASWSRAAFERETGRSDLVIDGVFGTGFSGAPRDIAAEAIDAMNGAGRPVLAIDIASGVSGVDGSTPGVAVRAAATVAIQALKPGHVMLPGAVHAGVVHVADIGIAVHDAQTFVPNARDVRGVLPETEPDTHKYRVGALAVLAGSTGMTGAAILTARAAIRAGVGMVVLGVPSSTLDVFENAVVEAIKVPLPESEGMLDAKAVDEFADRLSKCRALAIGPGLGRGPQSATLIRSAIDIGLPTVIDGDGLWALAEAMKDDPDVVRGKPVVLTPHSGEFAFLVGRPPADDRIADVRETAERFGAVVHLKGRRADTASPQGTVWVNTSGNPGAATAGSGDVLTGVVGSLLAQGMMPEAAMWAGAFVHGRAADAGASRVGERSLAAGDIADALPRAFADVGRSVHITGRLRRVLEAI